MMENTNQTVQNLDEEVMRNLTNENIKVDDSDDFYYEDPEDGSTGEMVYSTKPEEQLGTESTPIFADQNDEVSPFTPDQSFEGLTSAENSSVFGDDNSQSFSALNKQVEEEIAKAFVPEATPMEEINVQPFEDGFMTAPSPVSIDENPTPITADQSIEELGKTIDESVAHGFDLGLDQVGNTFVEENSSSATPDQSIEELSKQIDDKIAQSFQLDSEENTDGYIEEQIAPEMKDFQLTDTELAKVEEDSKMLDGEVAADFDSLFDSLYSDVTGANNFISNLIEQKKNVNTNEANLIEMQEKLDKDREEFEKYLETQKEAIELEKEQCKEFVRTQKARLANEEAQFNSDVEATRAELSLSEQTLKMNNEKLEDEKHQFSTYKGLEEEKLRSDRQKLDSEKVAFAKEKSITEEKLKSERLKLETEKEQFEKERSLNDEKITADRQTLEAEKEQFMKEKALDEEKIKNAQDELKKQEEQFAKFKALEEKKLELESKNLSQSCARFKELVSQFNSGFQQLPGDKE